MSKADYYNILGVSRDASEQQLKRAYRDLAFQYHPDRNPGDEEAEARFKAASEAYEVLTDPRQREIYDNFGHEGLNKRNNSRGAGFESVEEIFSQFEDLFGDVFGFGAESRREDRSKPKRGRDIQRELTISFDEAIFGTARHITIERTTPCEQCEGTGAAPGTEPVLCQECGGTGEVMHTQGFFTVSSDCPACDGRGSILPEVCDACDGEGEFSEERRLQIKVPAGVDDGTRLRVKREGEAGLRGGERGDVIVNIRVEEHDYFERDGLDLHFRAHLNFIQAALGCEIEVPTIHGGLEILEIQPGAQFGDTRELDGLGVTHVNGKKTGDLVVHMVVATPKDLDDEQRKMLRAFADHSEIELDRIRTVIPVSFAKNTAASSTEE